ncbi:unnamed protein product [Aphanomyces euteiches]
MIGRRTIATASNYVKRLVEDANKHPTDSVRQLRVLQMLGKIHPSLVAQRVEEMPFAMSQEAHKEYMKALVRTGRIDAIDLKIMLARMQSTGMPTMTPQLYRARRASPLVDESGYRAWAAFATMAWGSIVGLSLYTFWNEEGWKEEHPMTAGFMRGLELQIDRANVAKPDKSKKKKASDKHVTPYENVSDIPVK